MAVDTSIVVALIAIAGALALASVGYLLGRKERLQAVMDTGGLVVGPQTAVSPPSSWPLQSGPPPPMPFRPGPSLDDLLVDFAREHQTHRAAIFDANGLLIRHVGLPPDSKVGAAVGSFARCIVEIRSEHRATNDAWVEYNDPSGSGIRARSFAWKGQLLMLAALDVPPRIPSTAEQAVLAAAPSLIAS